MQRPLFCSHSHELRINLCAPAAFYFRLVLEIGCIVIAPRPTWTHPVNPIYIYIYIYICRSVEGGVPRRMGLCREMQRAWVSGKERVCVKLTRTQFPTFLYKFISYRLTTVASGRRTASSTCRRPRGTNLQSSCATTWCTDI